MYRVALYNDPQSGISKVIDQSAELAFRFAEKAALEKHVESMKLLSGYYLNGYGTAADGEQAAFWKQRYDSGGRYETKTSSGKNRLKIVHGDLNRTDQCNLQ